MKKIPLTQGKFAIVDDEDFESLSHWKWYYASDGFGDGYAIRADKRINGKCRKTIRMHRQIMQTPEGLQTDHINHKKTDNRKINLRICTRLENSFNKNIQRNHSSGFKGVSFRKDIKKWQAIITINKFQKRIGYFITPEEAARAYDNAAQPNFGEFAKINFNDAMLEPIEREVING